MLLIVDDEKPTREGLRAALEDHYDVYVAEDAASAMGLLEHENFAVLLTDFRLPNEDQNPRCTACTDDRKNQLALGMEIVRGMVQQGSKAEWEDGTICDPKNGKIYDCEMWIDPAKPNELKVRGYFYFVYRTQTWVRVK